VEDDRERFEKSAFGIGNIVWDPNRPKISTAVPEVFCEVGRRGERGNLLVQPLCGMDLVTLESTVVGPHTAEVNIFT